MQCNAKAKRTGNQCERAAMRGKDKCCMHGGKTPIKHGLFSKYAPFYLQEKIKAAEKVEMKDKVQGAINLYSAMLVDYFQHKHTNTVLDIQIASVILEKLVNAVYKYEQIDKEIGKPLEVKGKLEYEHIEKSNEELDETIAKHFSAYLQGHADGSKASNNGERAKNKNSKTAKPNSQRAV